ncbi:hypothetical protein GOB81_00030 [Acetobacter sp. LMG 1627]|uniref:Uncharacterized protein n=2 Tax=Acetobacter conturbans TaxID=1737472 RepID=A0ABX0JUU8_9PROT|nr:cobaltochelatase subunit CobN [Acetobacter conturbans]NHN87029.1 hypothetical protein [Acetobacter conturbans]
MMRHGFRHAAEMTATIDNVAAFAQLIRVVAAHLFDVYYKATLGRDDLVTFMGKNNPTPLRRRFEARVEAGLWITRRNAIAASLRNTL